MRLQRERRVIFHDTPHYFYYIVSLYHERNVQMECRWHDIDREMTDYYKKNCSKRILPSTNATGTGLESSPCLHGESSATKYLSLDTTSDYEWVDKGLFVSPARHKTYSPNIPPPDKPLSLIILTVGHQLASHRVVKYIQSVPGGMCHTSGKCSLS